MEHFLFKAAFYFELSGKCYQAIKNKLSVGFFDCSKKVKEQGLITVDAIGAKAPTRFQKNAVNQTNVDFRDTFLGSLKLTFSFFKVQTDMLK